MVIRSRASRQVVWLSALLGACVAPAAEVTIADLGGGLHTPQAVRAGDVHVVVFTSQECPIANAYAPTLGRLAEEWADLPVRMFLVHTDPELTVAGARKHRDEYRLPGTILMDPGHELAATLGAIRTPEAVVLTHKGIAYRGRIDDQWQGLGVRATEATTHELRDAVGLAMRGEKMSEPYPAAVGCLLPDPSR